MLPPDCTLTTAAFNLIKYNQRGRTIEQTIENMSALLRVPCFLVIYTDSSLYEAIRRCRGHLDVLTRYEVIEIETLEAFQLHERVVENRKKYYPTRDERTCVESHLVCASKFELVLRTIAENPFKTRQFGWIDSNVGINFGKICTGYRENMLLNVLHNCRPNKFHLQILNVVDKRFVTSGDAGLREYYSQYRWVVCGCLFVTGADVGIPILQSLREVFIRHTHAGYGHAEEMFYLEVLDKHWDDIERSYGDYCHILNNFVGITTGIDYILRMAQLYLDHKYYRECIDCCRRVIAACDAFTVAEVTGEQYFLLMFCLYVATYYWEGQHAAAVVIEKLRRVCDVRPDINTVYESKRDWYDEQFRFCIMSEENGK